MGKVVSTTTQRSAAEGLVASVSEMDGVAAEVIERNSGTSPRNVVIVSCDPERWRGLAESLRNTHGVDYCSMITGIHWPEGGPEKNWEVVYHFLRMAVSNPPVIDGMVEPIVIDPTKVEGNGVPLEIEVRVNLPETREPCVASVQDIWVGADWNEKETWDLVGIDFEGHVGMRRVLQPHETPTGFHPLQKQHKLRYHDFEEMYDDVQGFLRKPSDAGKIK
ncbi:MAG: NADH-quinone oxidoreductase subunit C [Candidatus Thermoplasmatota archaeon]|nr:NADH-quinone oxidoreductase subunit C [Candidatus Thermoplasmatota archaeon]